MNRWFVFVGATFRRGCASPWWPLVMAGVGIVLVLPAAGTGWQMDDFMHRGILTGTLPPPPHLTAPFGLFTFATGDAAPMRAMREWGIVPWWTFAGIRLAFFRPLSELTHWLDYRLWPDSPWLMHVHSFLWFGAAIWAAAILFQRIMGAGWAAGLAAFIFAVDKDHGLPVAWIANRHALICTVFGILTLILHDRWRRDGWRKGSLWGPVCYLMGLLAGETTLTAGAFVFAYAMFLDRGRLSRRAMAFLPYAAITAGWAWLYHRLGYGAHGMAAYLDPGGESLAYLRAVVERGPILLAGQFFWIPAALYGNGAWPFGRYGDLCLWGAAVALLLCIGILLAPALRRDAAVRFWTAGLLLGLAPACATLPSGRLLFFAGIGASGIVAAFLTSWLERVGGRPARRSWRVGAGAIGSVFLILHLLLAPLVLPWVALSMARLQQALITRPALSLPDQAAVSPSTVVLIDPPLATLSLYYSFARAEAGRPIPLPMHTLASARHPLTITRSGDRSLDLSCAGGLLQSSLDQLFRGPSQPMRVGERIALRGMTVEILDVAGWQPSGARFTFSVPLSDPSLRLLRWQGGRWAPYTPPALGQTEALQVTWREELSGLLRGGSG